MEKRHRVFYGWWIVILLFLAGAFGGAVVWHTFTTFFDPLIREFGWSYTAISLAASLKGVESGLADVLVGFLIDRLGGRRIILAGTVLIGVGYLLLSRVNSLAIFYLLYIVIFVGATGTSNVVFFAVVAKWFRKRLGLALGITAAGYGAGGFAVPGVVYLLAAVGFRMTFFIFGASAILVGAVITYFVRSRPEDIGSGPDGLPLEGAKTMEQSANAVDSPVQNYTFKQAVRTPAYWVVVYIGAASVFAWSTVSTHVMPYLEHIGYARYTAGIVAMMVPIMSMAGRIGFGGLSDFFRLRVILVLTIIGQVIAIVLFYYAYLPATLVPFVVLFGACGGGMAVIRMVLLRAYYGAGHIGSLLGCCLGLTNIGSIGGPLTAGWIFDSTGSYDIAWIAVIILLLIGLPLVWLMGQPQPGLATGTAVTGTA